MIPILCTDTDQVRSSMLLAAEDLPDGLFNTQLWERQLKQDLVVWFPTYADYLPVDEDTAIGSYLASYCTYWCAYQAALTLTVSLPEEIGDGKNVRKLAPNNEALLETLRANLTLAKRNLMAELGIVVSTTPKFMTSVGLAVDPVTNA